MDLKYVECEYEWHRWTSMNTVHSSRCVLIMASKKKSAPEFFPELTTYCQQCLGLAFCLFATGSRMALGPTQPPIQWVPGALSRGSKVVGA
jgi:hypothetical protein